MSVSRFLSSVLCGLLFGCTTIGSAPPPEDWPMLTPRKYTVSNRDMRDICGKYTEASTSPQGCALIIFKTMECAVVESEDFPLTSAQLEHEADHCTGKDHVGSTYLRELWAQWTLNGGKP